MNDTGLISTNLLHCRANFKKKNFKQEPRRVPETFNYFILQFLIESTPGFLFYSVYIFS